MSMLVHGNHIISIMYVKGLYIFLQLQFFLVWNLKDFMHRGISSKINFTVLKLQNEKNSIHKWNHITMDM